VLSIYVGSLLFGGLLIAASLLGAGHGTDAHAGGDGGGAAGDGHDTSTGQAWLALFGLRFWSFAAAFFGLTGLVVSRLGGPSFHALAPAVAAAVGVGAGLGASATFRALSRDTIGQVRDAAALVGREGRLLLPVQRRQPGKVRLASPGGGDLDLVAESTDDEALPAGAEVLVVEVRGNVAIVTRAPATGPARSS